MKEERVATKISGNLRDWLIDGFAHPRTPFAARATESTPFGPDVLVFKVGGKMFALAALDEMPTRVNLKCDPDLALELRDRYEQVTPGYHMNKRHWNTVEIESGVPDAAVRRMVDDSYNLVTKTLPKSTAKVPARSRRNSTAVRRGPR
jgi:predicted DNA-binding protein (MmcQ/YjbR family)